MAKGLALQGTEWEGRSINKGVGDGEVWQWC